MFARINAAAIALVLALPMVMASPLEARTEPACNTGSALCCHDTTSGSSSAASAIGGLLGLTGSLGKLVGLSCNPINVIGLGGNTCTQQTVCCTNNSFNGVIALGCTPINISA